MKSQQIRNIVWKRFVQFAIPIYLISSLLHSCKKSDSSGVNLKGKVFYGVITASCNPTNIVSITRSSDYVLMIFEDAAGNDISYQPKPNTWYHISPGGLWAKTGSDVTPKDIPIGFGFLATEYSAPCQ